MNEKPQKTKRPPSAVADDPTKRPMDDLHAGILDAARRGEDQQIVLSIVILRLANGEDRIVIADPEHGDGEGTRFMVEFRDDVLQAQQLLPGESIRVEQWEMRQWREVFSQ